jgi:diaminohydroxyphosphoribosylaminopyrimidine deaminase/5-amino-6-(5-phosphoribosylamino)uracil reductase
MGLSTFCLVAQKVLLPEDAEVDRRYFLNALYSAQFARGTTYPNPTVGALIAKDGIILAQGVTHAPGGMHAEIHAIATCKALTHGATLYVTLEPCSSFGRTPPCTDAIINAQIKRVVYGAIDPHPAVCGSGIAALNKAKIVTEIIADKILQNVAEALLVPFKTWVLHKRPYVVVKIATSADGQFAKNYGAQTKITGNKADEMVHAMRRASDAVLVGGNTVRIDNPRLSARLGQAAHGQQPASIVISSSGDIPSHAHLMHRMDARSVVIVPHGLSHRVCMTGTKRQIEIIEARSNASGIDLVDAFARLATLGFTLVMVEAGPRLFAQLVKQQLADEIFWFRSQEVFNSDGSAIENLLEFICASYSLESKIAVGEDDLLIFGA